MRDDIEVPFDEILVSFGLKRGFGLQELGMGDDEFIRTNFPNIIVGEHAGDLIAEYVLAMRYKLGLNKILGTIRIYPTLAEANKFAAGEWKKAHAPQFALKLLEKYHAWQRG